MKREEVIYCLKAQSERHSEVCEECPLYGQTGVDHCCEDALQMAITALHNQPVWIPVSERLPEERDSIFAKFKGTDKWKKGMFEKTSSTVIVTVCSDDGSRRTTTANTIDGRWKTDIILSGDEVIAWMPLPEPYRESEVEYGK